MFSMKKMGKALRKARDESVGKALAGKLGGTGAAKKPTPVGRGIFRGIGSAVAKAREAGKLGETGAAKKPTPVGGGVFKGGGLKSMVRRAIAAKKPTPVGGGVFRGSIGSAGLKKDDEKDEKMDAKPFKSGGTVKASSKGRGMGAATQGGGAVGGAAKKKGYAMGGMAMKKGYAAGGPAMKKGYAMGGAAMKKGYASGGSVRGK